MNRRTKLILSSLVLVPACVVGTFTLDQASQTIEGTTASRFGHAMATGFDLTKADFNVDVAIGAPIAGKVYLYEASQLEADPTLDETDAIVFTGAAGGEAGWSLAGGDVAADGWYDLAVGAPSEQSGKGRIYILDGGDMGTKIGAASIVSLTGETAGDYAGWSLAVGDINGDAKLDLVVGACGYNEFQGRIYVEYGPIPAGARSLANADIKITGDRGGASFGCDLATGDLNGDGRDEIVTGAIYQNQGGAGAAWIIWNPAAGSRAVTATDHTLIEGWYFGENLGFSVAIGNANGDEYDDLLVGAPFNHCLMHDSYPEEAGGADCQGGNPAGTAYLFVGGPDAGGDHAIADGFALDLYDVRYGGTVAGDLVGFDVEFGDFNDDAHDEIVLGSGIHKTFVFQGVSTMGNIPQNVLTSAAVATVDGTADARRVGARLARLGDVNGDGIEDLAVAGNRQRWFEEGPQAVEGEVFFFHGDRFEP